MKTLLSLLLLPLLLAAPSAQDLARADLPVVRFGERTATRADLAEWLLVTRGELLASRFLDAWLFEREARRLGLPDVSADASARVEAEIQERIDKAYGGNEAGWLNELKSARRTPAGRRAERHTVLAAELNLRAIANHERVVPEAKVVRDWEKTYGPGGRRMRVRVFYRRVVMPPMVGLTAEQRLERSERVRDERKQELFDIRERVRGGESFAGICARSSDDPETRGTGGRPADGGFLDTLGWPAATLDEIAALSPGDLCDPVFLRGGLWMVQLEEVVTTPFEQVEAELRAELAAAGPETDEIAAAAASLREGVALEVLPAMYISAEPNAPLDWSAPVLRIDGASIPRGEYAEYLLDSLGDSSARRFCEELLIESLAAEAGIAPTPEEVEAKVESDVAHLVEFFHDGDRASWEDETTRVRGSVESWYRDARLQRRFELILSELFRRDRVITDDLLRQVWRARYGENGRSLQMRMIRIDAVPPELPEGISEEEAMEKTLEAIEEARVKAQDVAERALNGEDFVSLVKRYSMDESTRDNGGELPLGFDYRTLPVPAVTAIEAMKPGQVSEAIDLEYSHLILELVSERNVPYDTVSEALRVELETAEPTNVETRGHFNVLTRTMEVEVLPALFE